MSRSPWRARVALVLTAAIVGSFLSLVGGFAVAPAAVADTRPDPGVPATASAKPLPTWQIDGVAWSQVVVGNTVYVTGNFTTARPPKVAVGGAGQVNVGHLLAYDIRTGNRISSFNHVLNAQGRGITASPDGTKLYVTGDFTTVDGVARGHVAAFDVATGNLVTSFAPNVNGVVRAVTATNSVVYFGGGFSQVGGVRRGNLAAVNAADGSLRSWAPGTDNVVWSMVLTPAQDKVVIGGTFLQLNATDSFGHGAVSASTGGLVPWLANSLVHDYKNGAINALSTDGTYVYGTGFAFGDGATFEGTYAANPADGSIHWIYDCLGDTYGAAGIGDVVYTVGHSHDCTMINSFPDTSPRSRWQHSIAFTKDATQLNKGPDVYGWNYKDQPAPSMLQWFPSWAAGTATGQSQAGWHVTGNSSYVVVGGEFPAVNNIAQQGLTRFGIGAAADNTLGPAYDTKPARAVPSTTAGTVRPGTVRVAFGSAWDKDNETLSYQVVRDGTTNVGPPVLSKSNFWTLPTLAVNDTGVPSGQHTYRVKISDPLGNVLQSPVSNAVAVSSTIGAYGDAVVADAPLDYWRLGEPSGNIGLDGGSAGLDLSTRPGLTWGADGAVAGNTAAVVDGTTAGTASTTVAAPAPDSFAVEGWFKTTTTSGGKLFGYGNTQDGTSGSYDRHVYMTNEGRLVFGVYTGATSTIASADPYNDGQWHHVVASMGPKGMLLLVDGLQVGKNSGVTSGQPFNGYWLVGGDSLGGWPSQPSSNFFQGSIDEVAVYGAPLSVAQVRSHYTASGRTVNVPPPPSDSYGSTVVAAAPDFYWRLNESSGTLARDTMGEVPGNLTGGATPGAAGAVPGQVGDLSVALDGVNGNVTAASPVDNPTVYSEELWFQTTTRSGGKLIGLGDQPTGNSGGYDRHVWMLNDGRLRFGTWTGAPNIAESTRSYNDGSWHHMVATQGPAGMKLYVDGQVVGTNPQTQAQAYTGYWRVGGDTHWGDADSFWFAGRIDEVAVYSRALSAAEVKSHFVANGRSAPNADPVPSFTVTTSGLTARVDGSASSDPDGTVTDYRWTFGDGATATGPTASHAYAADGTYPVTLTVTDDGGASVSTTQQVAVTAPPADAYGAAVVAANPRFFWRLDDTTGPVRDAVGRSTGTPFGPGITYHRPGKVNDGAAAEFDGQDSGIVSTETYDNPTTYSEELWFNTTTRAGGKLIGFGNAVSGNSNNYDRHVYMLASGQLQFGVYTGQLDVIGSPLAYNDGLWHHLVASQGQDGMKLWLDGALVASGSQTQAQAYSGHWRIGGDSSWADSNYFAGQLDEVAVYPSVLGAADVRDHFVKGGGQLPNAAPTASMTATLSGRTVTVDGSTSSDPDGSIASYAWDFGDGSTATGARVDHTFAAAGSHEVRLVVTDDRGATGSTSQTVVIGNTAPTAAFTTGVRKLGLTVDASGSSDPDGSIRSYAWDFGDGSTATGRVASHTYAIAGDWTVTLTLTDDDGATATTSKVVTTVDNQAPTAAFTPTVSGLDASLDATASSDTDGTVASYGWDFGDGSQGTGSRTTHTYAVSGAYAVKLTVTDDDGASSSVTRTVTVASALAQDAFARTVTRGLGSADLGGPWSLSGAPALFSVGSGWANLQMASAGKGSAAALAAVSSDDTDLRLQFTFDKAPTGGGYYAYFTPRGGFTDAYRTKVAVSASGVMTLSLTKLVAGTETQLVSQVVTGVTFTPGAAYTVRTQAVGSAPTRLTAKIWRSADAEPSAWLLTRSDSTAALQGAGGVAVTSYLSGSSTGGAVTLRIADLLARRSAGL